MQKHVFVPQGASKRSRLMSSTQFVGRHLDLVSATVPNFLVRRLAECGAVASRPRVTVHMDPVSSRIVGWSIGFDDDAPDV